MPEIRYCPQCDEMQRVDEEWCCTICEARTTNKTRAKLDAEIEAERKDRFFDYS